jgi:transcriptional regulator with XRE-family HTH domain
MKSKRSPFAKILTELMEEQAITVRRAATMAGVGPSTVNSWRSGAAPLDFLAVHRLAQGLGVSFQYLLTGKHEVQTAAAPSVSQVSERGEFLFDGFAEIKIQRLIPKTTSNQSEDDK